MLTFDEMALRRVNLLLASIPEELDRERRRFHLVRSNIMSNIKN